VRALFRLVRLLVAVAAVAVGLAVLVGVPPLLLALGGNPLPRRVPSLDDVTGLLTGVDAGGRVLLWALAACGWVAWAVLAACLLLEVGARLVGRRAPRLPGLGGPQRLAGVLVAVTAVEDANADPAGPTAPLVHEVAPGDWMWHIAGRYLGDERRYPEIAALNPRYAARYPGFPDHIRPGDLLVLPADAYDRGERPHATGALHGSPPPAPSEKGPPPPGPAGEAGPERDPVGSGTTREVPDPEQVQPEEERPPVPSGPEPPDPEPVRWPYPGPRATSGATPTPAATTAPGTAGVTARGGADQPGRPLVPVAGGLIASALAAGAVARWRRRARRPRGGAPRDPVAAPTPVAGPGGTDTGRLDRTLRCLPAGGTVADVAAVWVAGGDIHLLLAAPSPPPAPFTADGAGGWILPATVALPDPGATPCPVPTLVTVGFRPGAQLLVDLESIGAVTVAGAPDRCLDLLRHVVAELAHHPWSSTVRVTVAGFPPDQAGLLAALDPDRVRVAGSVGRAAAAHRERLVEVAEALAASGLSDARHARVVPTGPGPRPGQATALAPDTWSPWVLVAYAGPDCPAADRTALADLAAELSRAGRPSGVAVVVTWGESPDGGPGAVGAAGGAADGGHGRITVGPDGTLSAAFLDGGGDLHAPALPAELLGPYVALVRGGAGDPDGGRRGGSAPPDLC
jgi:hypothetical protein